MDRNLIIIKGTANKYNLQMIIIQPNCFKYDAESVERIQNRGYFLHVEVNLQCTHTCSSLIILITHMQ